jgi:predicted aconitase
MKTVVTFGELFGATKLVALQAAPHLAMSWGLESINPFLRIYQRLADAGLTTYAPFTANPKPMDKERFPLGTEGDQMMFNTYNVDDQLTAINERLGMLKGGWSCASYLPQVSSKTPHQGDNLSWSESSAVVFANSVLGARTNANSMGIDMMTAILGKAPYFGYMTDAGRKANWLIKCNFSKLPHPELLGGAIGTKVLNGVPYIAGIEKLVNSLGDDKMDYLKDMGAGAASAGAVALYHMEGVTPEVLDQGRDLLMHEYQVYEIDDAELTRIYNAFPNMWADKGASPQRAFIGCPHSSLAQIKWWGTHLVTAIETAGRQQVSVPTYIFAFHQVIEQFKSENPEVAKKMADYGIIMTRNCPMMHLVTPLLDREIVVTNSNKTRNYTSARFYLDDDLTQIIVTGELPTLIN